MRGNGVRKRWDGEEGHGSGWRTVEGRREVSPR